MKPRLYLHVGVHRTATTSIQRFLRANFEALLGKGYLYPFGVARHNAVVSRMRYGVLEVADFAEDLARRMAAKGVQAAILSDEDLSAIADFGVFAALTRVFEVRVVVMLRRQDLWLESWYLQNVKWQWNADLAHLTFEEFLDRRGEFFWIHYAARMAQYEAVFGPGAVIAGVFEEADMPLGPIDAFLRMVGIADHGGFGPMLHQNSSLTPLATEFMRHLPLDQMEGPDRRVFEQACLLLDQGLKTNGSKLLMSQDRRLAVQAEYLAGNLVVAARYLGREALFRVPLPGAEQPLASSALPAASDDLLRDFVAPFVRALGAQVAAARAALPQGDAVERPGQRRRRDQV